MISDDRYCPNCQYIRLATSYQYCPKCGTKLEVMKQDDKEVST